MKTLWTRPPQPAWRKASFCAGGECAQVAKQENTIILRSSVKPRRVVRYSAEEWGTLLRGIKAGEFDDLG